MARPFASDDELREYLGLPNDPRGRAEVAAIGPGRREELATMRAIEREINAGTIPRRFED